MPVYAAPLSDIRFIINEIVEFDALKEQLSFGEVTPDLVDAILEEAARLAAEVLAPLNPVGDHRGAVFEDGRVTMPDGFIDAYRQFVEGGWNGLPFPEDVGGQGLPYLLSTAVSEIWSAANMAFALCPMLTQSAVEALALYGSEELKAIYLPKLVSGEWTGTMNLTEPQAGSDLSRVRTRAVREGDHYRIAGQKIFITYGEHDLAPNIIHMVLARIPDAPEGVKGLSLFLVPKILVDDDGGLGEANDVRCVSIEHKLGIKASPTALLAYGDHDGAIGYLVGQENRGLELMFTMMNQARLGVGLEGVGIADRAYQRARSYAQARTQGRELGGAGGEPVPISHHPDVQRMLLTMKSQTEATRALAYFAAAQVDVSRHHPDEAERHQALRLVDLLTPVVKAWSTDIGIEVASIGIQVHGGMGYIEESGAPQHLRDARIATIYEGTNGIQAMDLVSRKVMRDGGETVGRLLDSMRAFERTLGGINDPDIAAIAPHLGQGISDLAESTAFIVETFGEDPRKVSAGAVHYLALLGTVAGGWLMTKAAVKAAQFLGGGDGDPDFLRSKLITARFFADSFLVRTEALKAEFIGGNRALADLDPDRHL